MQVDNGYGIHRCRDGSHASHGGRRKTIADLQAQVATLTSQVRQLTDKQPLVSSSLIRMDGHLNILMEETNSFAKGKRRGGPKKSPAKDLEKEEELRNVVNNVCSEMKSELEKLQQVILPLRDLRKFDYDRLVQLLSETLEQAKHDDVCIRKLANLLNVNSTQVVGTVKKLLSRRSPLHVEIPRGHDSQTPDTCVFQAHQEQTVTTNGRGSEFREAMRQIQSPTVPPRTELMDFDPIAAAAGDQLISQRRSGSDGSQLRRHILPVRRNLPYFQSEQPASVPRMVQESPCKSPSRRCQGGDLNNLEYGRDSSISAAFAAMAFLTWGYMRMHMVKDLSRSLSRSS